MIAIIAILAGMLLPTLNQAREKAKISSCASNMKQIASAQLIYTADFEDRSLPNINWAENATIRDASSWIGSYFSVASNNSSNTNRIGSIKILDCPERVAPNLTTSTSYSDFKFGDIAASSFHSGTLISGYNFLFGTAYNTSANSFYGWTIYESTEKIDGFSTLNCPRLTMLGQEITTYNTDVSTKLLSPTEQPALMDAYALGVETLGDNTEPRHISLGSFYKGVNNHDAQKGHNIAYCDGHVKWLKDTEAKARHKDYHHRFGF